MTRLSRLLWAATGAIAVAAVGPAYPATIVIHAGHLLAQPGRPAVRNHSVVVEDGKIVAIKNGFIAGDTVLDLKKAWVMPGLIDMHTHVTDVLKLDAPAEGQIALAYMKPQAE